MRMEHWRNDNDRAKGMEGTVLSGGTEKSHRKSGLVCAPNEMPEEWGTSERQAAR